MKQHKTVYSYWLKDTIGIMNTLGLPVSEITKDLPGLLSSDRQSSSWIEVSIARQLWHNAFRQTQDSAIGFKVGQRLSIRAFNVISLILSHSPTVAEAIKNASRYQQLLSQSGQFQPDIKPETTTAFYRPARSHIPIHFSQIDSVLAGFVKALRLFVSEDMPLKKVALVGPDRSEQTLYEDFYQCPVVINEKVAFIEFSSDYLMNEITNTDSTIYRMGMTLAEDRLSRLNDVEQLHASVAEAIASLNYAHADVKQVASELALSARTLQRKLNKSGTSFRQIQEEVILKETSRLLMNSDASIHEIGHQMGYTETSSFSRAIKNMSGMSPMDIKRS